MAQNVKFTLWICLQAESFIQKFQYSQNCTFLCETMYYIFLTIIIVMPYKLKEHSLNVRMLIVAGLLYAKTSIAVLSYVEIIVKQSVLFQPISRIKLMISPSWIGTTKIDTDLTLFWRMKLHFSTIRVSFIYGQNPGEIIHQLMVKYNANAYD